MTRLLLAVLTLLGFWAQPASAALSPAQLAAVQAEPSATARLPLDLPLRDLGGRPASLRVATAGRPSLLILSDWRCTQLCGSLLGIAADALRGSGLSPRDDFSFLVVGFNPEAGAGDAESMRDGQMAGNPSLRAAARFLTGTPQAIDTLEKALGFTPIRDTEAGRYAHPADLYVLTADGRVSSILNGLSLDPDAVRLALVQAGEGRIGSLVDRLHVLCYGLDPLSGASTALAQTMLRVGASLTLVAAGMGAALWLRRNARARPQA